MPIEELKVACPRCSNKFFVPASNGLKEGCCPSCMATFTIPEVFGIFIFTKLLAEDFFSQTCDAQRSDESKVKVHRIKPEFCTSDFSHTFDIICNKFHIAPVDGMSRIIAHGKTDGSCWYECSSASNGNLKQLLNRGKLDYSRAHDLAEQIVRIMKASSDKGFLHGNLKTSVIRLDINENIEIEDFGLTRQFGSMLQPESEVLEFWNLRFTAPEARKTNFVPTKEADIFSLGAVLYNTFSGRQPFFQCDDNEIESGHSDLLPLKDLSCGCADELSSLIASMLAEDPHQRPSYSDISRILDAYSSHDTGGAILQEFEGNLDRTMKLSAKKTLKVDLLNQTTPTQKNPQVLIGEQHKLENTSVDMLRPIYGDAQEEVQDLEDSPFRFVIVGAFAVVVVLTGVLFYLLGQ